MRRQAASFCGRGWCARCSRAFRAGSKGAPVRCGAGNRDTGQRAALQQARHRLWHAGGAQKHCKRGCPGALPPSTASKHCFQALPPSTSSKHCFQTLPPSTASKHCFQALPPSATLSLKNMPVMLTCILLACPLAPSSAARWLPSSRACTSWGGRRPCSGMTEVQGGSVTCRALKS